MKIGKASSWFYFKTSTGPRVKWTLFIGNTTIIHGRKVK